MNKNRRKVIESLVEQLDDLKSHIEEVKDEEEEYIEMMPENLKDGERGQAAQEALDHLEEVISSLDDASYTLQEAAE